MGKDFDVSEHVYMSNKLKDLVKDALTFFLNTPTHALPLPGQFTGAGVYALYYDGQFSHYKKVQTFNQMKPTLPTYIGKATPAGWRRGRVADSSNKLHGRINEHCRSINQVTNLELSDFHCSFMIMDGEESDLIGTIESALIRHFKPLWNSYIDGFGNHDPGSGRYRQAPSEWDVLHPGRSWATRLQGIPPELTNILENIKHHDGDH